ncbi:GPO family capsid scaffolding protein [Thalassotalea sp. 1_MG-2023]|uniref:GPO family capsid scaffolding protein n=1 Tax=Thalassotalea sp. 1_MG-2023 TaxID=3062680 RepID=UPI0026E16471|nr:GPO family capsid scaffolding protein [Thalassotalea sp. 1_MG-2023]MDO6426228.1 GPO family capsid scaffolding protein [Thalassotalea sp. 1_MG-2023]
MKSSLRTLPQTIAAVGLTVDGREITEQDIDDIVETYNYDMYGARINLDHYGNWGAWAASDLGIELNGCMLGDVVSVSKGKTADGTTVLNAILCPNESLLKLNQADQAVYYSIEINRDFMKTGKTYLTGLAMTDYPASTRTTRANFNKNETPNSEQNNEITRSTLNIETQSEETAGFKNIFKNLFNKKDEEMKPEQFAQLQTALTEPLTQLATGFTAMQTSMQNIEEKLTAQPTENEGENEENTPEKPTEFSLTDNDDFKNVSEQVGDMATQIENLSKKLDQAIGNPAGNTTPADEENLGDAQFNGIY